MKFSTAALGTATKTVRRYSVSFTLTFLMTFSSRTSFRSAVRRFPPLFRLASWSAACLSP